MSSTSISNLGGLNYGSSGVLDQRLSVDVQGVDSLRRTVRTSPEEGLKQASKQFEVMFLQMMLKSMRDASPSEGMFSSSQEKTYTAMLDQQLSQHLSGRGLGLAEAMFKQLSRTAAVDDVSRPLDSTLQGSLAPSGQDRVLLAAPAPVPQATPNLSFYEAATAQATLNRSVYPQAQVEQFVTRLLPAAQRASDASGVPTQLIMAQAALESGWGRHEVRSEGGSPSYNLFGIKADKSWKGAVIESTTTEYVGGIAQKTRANFRAYGSYDESFADYAKFLASNPRYADVLATQDPAAAARGLQRAGYATDPEYGEKLVRIMKKMS